MGLFDDLENELLKWCTGQSNLLTAGTPTPYAALFTVAPTDTGGGTEVSGGSYARVSIVSKFAAPASGQVSNSGIVSWPAATADWGLIVAYGLFTASTGTAFRLRWALLPVPKNIYTGDVMSLPVGRFIMGAD